MNLKTEKSNIFFLVLLVFVYWRVFAPGIHVALDYHYIYKELGDYFLAFPQAWRDVLISEGFGEYSVRALWAWPREILHGLLSRLGVNFPTLAIFINIAPVAIFGVIGIRKLFNFLKISLAASWVGTLFYLCNTYFLLLFDGGQTGLAAAYAILPLSYILFKRSIGYGIWELKIWFALSVVLMSIFDPRIVYIFAILLSLDFLYGFIMQSGKDRLSPFAENPDCKIGDECEEFSASEGFCSRRSSGEKIPRSSDRGASYFIKSYIIVAALSGIIFLGYHAYWIIPSFISKLPGLPQGFGRSSQVNALSFANVGHSLFLLAPHWYKNIFGKVTALKPEFFLIPFLVFMAPILKKRNKEVGFWLLVAVVFIFLSKGINPPLSGIYPWLFLHVPGFSLFRDPTKFFFPFALSYSVLMAISMDEITKKLADLRLKNTFLNSLILNPKAFLFLITVYFLVLIRPVWLGQMTGLFAEPMYKEDHFKVSEILKKDLGYGRVLWIPTRAPLGFSSPMHTSVEALSFTQKRPFAVGVVGTYETFNFLREAPFMGQLFNIAGIKYIVYPYPDTRREELKQGNIDYYYRFLDQISSLPWVKQRLSDPPVPLIETTNHQDHFFVADNAYWVIGSDRIYNDLSQLAGFDLSKNAVIFTEEKAGLGAKYYENDFPKIIVFDEQKEDVALELALRENDFYFPASGLDFDPLKKTSWWKRETADLLWFRDFLQQKYNLDNLDFDYSGGWAIGEGSGELGVRSKILKQGKILFARLMVSNRGGKVEFFQRDGKLGEIDTLSESPEKVEIKLTGYKDIPNQVYEYDKADFKWFKIGILTGDDPVYIKTQGGINIVNTLATLSDADWALAQDNVTNLEGNESIIYWNGLEESEKLALVGSENNTLLQYERLSPTKYHFTVKGVDRPKFIAFSETYDPLWKIRDNKEPALSHASTPLYGLINGFIVDKDGDYVVYFEPQKYVYPGLVISGLTFVIILSLLIFLRKKEDKKV